MQAANIHRILIVDSQPLFRDGLRSHLVNQPEFAVCGEAESINEALKLIRKERPELVIMELDFADGHGLDLIRQAKVIHQTVRIMVLSTHDEGVYAERVLRAGATGFISKYEPADGILTALRMIVRGQIYASAEVTQRMLNTSLHRIDGQHSATDHLTDRELEIYQLLGQGMSSRAIASRLHLSNSTVDTYRERMKKKLGVQSGPELIRHAIQWAIESTRGDSPSPIGATLDAS
ncbi:response regulator transcription factor [Bremerella sp. JC770]|uniref:response regulator transcription factor n=1 Tax=Bremerella sp. JC770 TaxID=3232137 RepID=UPI00345839C9